MVTFYRRLPRVEYVQPKTIGEILVLRAQYAGKGALLAGGTDLMPKLKRREIEAPGYVIDLKGIPDLAYISNAEGDGLRIGALATLRAIETSALIQTTYNILSQTASSMASVQIRNRGTVAGNLCNGVPSADTAPPLLALDATVKLMSQKGERIVPLNDFFIGPNKTVLSDDELLVEIQVPRVLPHSRGVYLKLTQRSAMELAVVGVAVMVSARDGACEDIKIALGAVAPTPIKAKRAEAVLRGQRFSEELIEHTARTAAEESRPIDDHRASREYRRDMVKVLVERALIQTISLSSTL
jgi:CO/xanthine dehydrogenase FAD-binding subunit